MKKTTIKATINNNNDLSVNKHLLTVTTPINQVFTPTFKNIEIYPDIMDTIVYNGIHKTIARHCLNRLYSKGNMSAYEIMTIGTAIIDFDDIASEILLQLYNNRDSLSIIDKRLVIDNDGAIKAIYGACSRFMYQFMQKHYKHVYCEIDGQQIDIFNTKQLAQYANYSDIESMSLYQSFLSIVMRIYPKDYKRIEKIVKLRIDGMTYTQCANYLHCSTSTINRLKDKIVECANILYRTF